MIVLVSDLHLTDTNERSTINIPYFLQRIKALVKQAQDNGVERLTLVLLGDIFELLRSQEWIDHDVRPWETSTCQHIQTVYSIFESIVKSNYEFFEGLRNLAKTYPFFHIEYIPGHCTGQKINLLKKMA